MSRLLFFSRVALICNICFLITFLMHYIPFIAEGIVPSTIIIIGNVLAIVINIIVNVSYVVVALAGKSIIPFIPKWLVILNFIFFILQVILLIK